MMRKAIVVALAASCLLLMGATTTLVNLSLNVAGVLPTANGGTGQNSTATFPASGTVMTTATNVACAQHPALTGNVTSSAGSCATSIASGVVTNAMLASGAYVQGVYQAWCTGTVTASVTYYSFAGFGSSSTLCTGVSAAAGGMPMPTAGTVKNLRVNLSAGGKSTSKIQLYKNGSSTGAPTCTYGTGTSCSDTSSALSVAAGDVITIAVTSGSSDGSSNISVSFELWN